jgi:hypothetical protein
MLLWVVNSEISHFVKGTLSGMVVSSTPLWDVKIFTWLCLVLISIAFLLEPSMRYLRDTRPFSLGFYSLYSDQVGSQKVFPLQTFLHHISHHVEKVSPHGMASGELFCQPYP